MGPLYRIRRMKGRDGLFLEVVEEGKKPKVIGPFETEEEAFKHAFGPDAKIEEVKDASPDMQEAFDRRMRGEKFQ